MPKLLYFCPSSIGGVARNAIEQAMALADVGIEVTFLAPTDFSFWSSDLRGVNLDRCLVPGPRSGLYSRLGSRARIVASILANQRRLRQEILKSGFRHVMFDSYSEYLAPIWSNELVKLRNQGVRFGANILDPVRDHVVGPKWWHRYSVAKGYSFLDEAFVHQQITLDTVNPTPNLTTSVVPHGQYDYPPPKHSKEEMRQLLGIPQDVFVFLSFGHIRDNKNLALVIEALKSVPEVHLLVAGTEASPGQAASSWYQALAAQSGVAERVHWKIGYIADEDVSEIFGAADCLNMTYSASFRSASGILFVAVPLEMPVLVSAGDSPLCSLVDEYSLGLRIKPDSSEAIAAGMNWILFNPAKGRWSDLARDHSYKRAAEIIIDRLFGSR
jgi:glycosyltransferase involved in cell wall biosynthesis